MKMTRTILAVGAVFSAVVLGGCSHTVEVVVHNPSAETLAVRAIGPGIGEKALGRVPGKGGTLRKKVDLPSKALPADLTIEVGSQAVTFRITEDRDQVVVGISLKDGTLIKIGKDPITEEKKVDLKTPRGDPESVIE